MKKESKRIIKDTGLAVMITIGALLLWKGLCIISFMNPIITIIIGSVIVFAGILMIVFGFSLLIIPSRCRQ